jgi:hypothetical protein
LEKFSAYCLTPVSGKIFRPKYPIKEKTPGIKNKNDVAEGIVHGAWGQRA